jgi:hypothetical protein
MSLRRCCRRPRRPRPTLRAAPATPLQARRADHAGGLLCPTLQPVPSIQDRDAGLHVRELVGACLQGSGIGTAVLQDVPRRSLKSWDRKLGPHSAEVTRVLAGGGNVPGLQLLGFPVGIPSSCKVHAP